MADIDVKAKFTVETSTARKSTEKLNETIRRTQKSTEKLTGSAKKANSMFQILGGNLAAGAIQGGFTRMVSSMSRLVGGAVAYRTEMDNTRLGLQTMVQQVEKLGPGADKFALAGEIARKEFQAIRKLSIQSVATAGQLFEAYQGIYGPLRNAGLSMEDIRKTTQLTSIAGAALGIDMAQAARDISVMARGTAGMDVKLFTALRSMGAITMDAQKFNKLAPEKRAAEIMKALSGFEDAADAAGKTFGGVLSSVKGILQEMSAGFFAPFMDILSKRLQKVVGWVVANMDRVDAAMNATGQVFASLVEGAMAYAESGLNYITENWKGILDRMQLVVAGLKATAPVLIAIFAAMKAQAVASAVVGGAQKIAGTVTSVGAGIGMSVGGIGWAATLKAALGALAAAAWPVVLVMTLIASVVTVMSAYWNELSDVLLQLSPIVMWIGSMFLSIGESLWNILRPILKVIGIAFLGLVGILATVWTVVSAVVLPTLDLFLWAVAWIFEKIEGVIDAGVRYLLDSLSEILDFFGLTKALPAQLAGAGEGGSWVDSLTDKFNNALASIQGENAETPTTPTGNQAPPERAGTVNDFRGSKIEVKQDFRQADPDRIAYQMMDDIQRFAEQRISSGFATPLSG